MSSRDERQWVRDIENLHRTAITAAAAPAYNVLCGMSGTLYEGCGLTIRGPANGTNNANIDGISCCVLQSSNAQGGNRGQFTQAARNSIRQLYEWCSEQSGRRLAMRGHQQIVSTMCPGPDVMSWVSQGMPATGGAPSPVPPPPPEDELMASFVAAGQTTLFDVAPNGRFVVVCWQGPNALTWSGAGRGGSGWPAGWQPFAEAPAGHTIRAVDAFVAATGAPHVRIRTDRNESFMTWQNRDGSWEGRGGGFHAAFRHFAARP
jgi:hypothetical protein